MMMSSSFSFATSLAVNFNIEGIGLSLEIFTVLEMLKHSFGGTQKNIRVVIQTCQERVDQGRRLLDTESELRIDGLRGDDITQWVLTIPWIQRAKPFQHLPTPSSVGSRVGYQVASQSRDPTSTSHGLSFIPCHLLECGLQE